MLYGDVITLIADKTIQDADGYIVTEETRSEVFADTRSVARAEFYEAMRSGVQASIVFRMSVHDYDGQRIVEYEDKRYSVIRTYQTDLDTIELTCEETMRVSTTSAQTEPEPEPEPEEDTRAFASIFKLGISILGYTGLTEAMA